MSKTASQRPKRVFVILFAIAVLAVIAFAGWRLMGDDDPTKPLATGSDSTSDTATTTAPTTEPTKTKPTPKASCEGADTQFNVEGTEQESLLPDCGTTPVTRTEQKKKGLGLACGGSYPVILYKTTTTDAKTSICGKDASGESFRFVTKPSGGDVVDLPGSYDPQRDAFVAKKDGTSYAVLGYNGTLIVKKDGSASEQKSRDWISLDNESDYD
ncbi:hypothetical protein [Aeromicrobium sp. 9AM]|uniref:hypothetical protein n=1 Tax=Aeromicrobium sp. 9AM TaxID=2653126 RepID=UPI0012F378DC|nr:hypothetical protein [Aeromicrobium sp. 9AM]VXC30980.1 conserved exported hypothetical protein [Aeromicrobium sp. 9AM]